MREAALLMAGAHDEPDFVPHLYRGGLCTSMAV
jgi:hypothetical protein